MIQQLLRIGAAALALAVVFPSTLRASPVGTTVQSDVPAGQAVPLVNKQAAVVTSITLDKGNWVISGSATLFEQMPQTVVGAQTLNASAWISPTVTFNHFGAYNRDSRQFTAFPFTGFIALPMAPKVFHFDNEPNTIFLVARSGFQSFGANAPNTATAFGYILATRVP